MYARPALPVEGGPSRTWAPATIAPSLVTATRATSRPRRSWNSPHAQDWRSPNRDDDATNRSHASREPASSSSTLIPVLRCLPAGGPTGRIPRPSSDPLFAGPRLLSPGGLLHGHPDVGSLRPSQ